MSHIYTCTQLETSFVSCSQLIQSIPALLQQSPAASDEAYYFGQSSSESIIQSPASPRGSSTTDFLRYPGSSVTGTTKSIFFSSPSFEATLKKALKPKPPTSGDLTRLCMYLTAQQHNKLKQHIQQVWLGNRNSTCTYSSHLPSLLNDRLSSHTDKCSSILLCLSVTLVSLALFIWWGRSSTTSKKKKRLDVSC